METEPKAPKRRRNTKPETIIENAKMQQDNEREIKVEISKYSALDSILGNGKKTLRVLGLLFAIAIFLFLVIFVITISLKKIYSYSDITTNALGATTISSEKSEVSYWLYNTSQLWANSGITVSKGDVITVRSSGKFMTAIHHLYDDSKGNKKPKDAWVGSEGEKDNPDPTSSTYLRRQFRMFPNLPTGALVMQVVGDVPFDSQNDVNEDSQKKNFYFIGKERENIYIENSGTLYFSLNDIVLNERVIREMLQKELNSNETSLDLLFDSFKDNDNLGKLIGNTESGARKLGQLKTGVTIIALKDSKQKTDIDYYTIKGKVSELYSHNGEITNEYFKDNCIESGKCKNLAKLSDWKAILVNNKDSLVAVDSLSKDKIADGKSLKAYLDKVKPEDCIIEYRINKDTALKHINSRFKTAVLDDGNIKMSELEYYYRVGYKTAWFDDNLGSFLIIVEKDTSK